MADLRLNRDGLLRLSNLQREVDYSLAADRYGDVPLHRGLKSVHLHLSFVIPHDEIRHSIAALFIGDRGTSDTRPQILDFDRGPVDHRTRGIRNGSLDRSIRSLCMQTNQ